MSNPDLATLNTVQLALRGLIEALAAAGQIDPAKVAFLLQSFAANHTQGNDPYAHQMLLDLAEGMDLLAQGLQGKAAN